DQDAVLGVSRAAVLCRSLRDNFAVVVLRGGSPNCRRWHDSIAVHYGRHGLYRRDAVLGMLGCEVLRGAGERDEPSRTQEFGNGSTCSPLRFRTITSPVVAI